MTSERDIFSLSGPAYLTHINWDDHHHRRSVAACLVQGVYVLERDRQLNRMDTDALAAPWWESFGFKLVQLLLDDTDFSIFGAIYELRHSSFSQGLPSQTVPNAVIAFRGTITKSDSLSRDLELDLHVIRHGLHQTSRFQTAVEAVRKFAPVYANNIWLCGHSLGSAIAMLAGKGIAEQGVLLETFLFNPPYVSAPIERIKDRKLRTGLRIANSFITAGLAFAVKGISHVSTSNELFCALSSWTPCLFINRADHICSEYIGYFEHRKHMDAIGAGKIGRLATQHSIGGLFLNAVGLESQPFHLIPSANMCINLGSAADFMQAHGIHQWWSSDLQLQFNQYRFS
ncbi:GDSL esterase/lipase At4g10955-like [Nymphaea colorata]|nr:GDSL esterase/lipase At4g10955-like [Nymphaea colorata]XP_031495901.1 GDSL esterase/lipase At4g10955-like [Nymphaea colorata]XP_031495902.1 GDSL esterase/lipase At4g10955-like [Nymphaea colorata]XP_031495903.1 GDSL esterase/lipase At4g10955-like [Nymphaea colorata]XP_031495904.1 GDSL esterase/lipase At4g10955-like [Nymphaea colorata]XP_049935673.1 GDSL esterase/lipase At4g10955-like [Nymphaea colorata]XP_049935674.1 GDSL esterase/lipase At4g10955-like [Nymphaea colorata]